MARQKRSLPNAFEKLAPANDAIEASESAPVEPEANTSSNELETTTASAGQANETDTPDSVDSLLEMMRAQKERKTFEELHTRTSFFVRNELRKELDRVARREPHGFKTKFINYAIEKALREYTEVKNK